MLHTVCHGHVADLHKEQRVGQSMTTLSEAGRFACDDKDVQVLNLPKLCERRRRRTIEPFKKSARIHMLLLLHAGLNIAQSTAAHGACRLCNVIKRVVYSLRKAMYASENH